MSMVRVSAAARADFEALPRPIKARVLRVFERLADWPAVSGAKPMRGKLAGRHRIRTGDYRVLFSVHLSGHEWIVTIEAIGHRDGFYEE